MTRQVFAALLKLHPDSARKWMQWTINAIHRAIADDRRAEFIGVYLEYAPEWIADGYTVPPLPQYPE